MGNWTFKRHLSDDFLEALVAKSSTKEWWKEVLADRDVIVALRNDYLNVYHRGQALFTVKFARGQLSVYTHPKYLIDPALNKPVRFANGRFLVPNTEETLLTAWHDGALARLKRAATIYSGSEKEGCHEAAAGRSDILDVEIAFRRIDKEFEEDRTIPRIDLLRVVEDGGGAALEFWEAKAFGNVELGSMGYRLSNLNRTDQVHRAVLGQIEDYRQIIEQHGADLVASYRKACEQLSQIFCGAGRFGSDTLIGRIGTGDIPLRIGPGGRIEVNLLVFGFDEAQKKASKPALDQLKQALAGTGRLRAVGEAKRAFPPEACSN